MDAGAPYDARAVANFILNVGDSRKLAITQLSLYKMVYFAHGWYLTKTRDPLIEQEFEAWEFGPVVKVLRDQFKKFGRHPIKGRAHKLNIFSGDTSIVQPTLKTDDQNFLKAIVDEYHIYHAWKLSEMTHEEGSPWDKLWNAKEPIGRLSLRLTNAEIRAHFDSLPKRIQLS